MSFLLTIHSGRSDFYEKVFGWTISKWEGPFDYWLVTTGSDDERGINSAITPRMVPEQVTTDIIGVESVDNSLKKIVEAGEAPSRRKNNLFQALDMLPTALTQEGTCWCHTGRHVYEIVAVSKATRKKTQLVEVRR